MRSRTRWLALALAAFLTASLTAAQTSSPADWLFNRVLTTLEYNYYGYAKLDTLALRSAYLPRLEAVCADKPECPFEAASDLVTEMIGTLHDPHTYRLLPEQAASINRDFGNQPSLTPSLGFTFAGVPDAGALVVKRVFENGPTWRVGLRRGDVILTLNDRALETFSSLEEATRAVQLASQGKDPVRLEVRHAGGTPRWLEVTPQALQPPPPQLELRPDGIGVITFFQFKASGNVASRVHALIAQAQLAGVRGLVLDVRDSAGGLVSELLGVASAFLETPGFSADFRTGRVRFEARNGRFSQTDAAGRTTDATVVPKPVRFDGPLVVLTNGLSKSAPEYLAYTLQRSARALVLGEPTLGALNTSNSFFQLPDGSAMAVSLGRSQNTDGSPFPERVTPDQTVRDDLAALAAGRDLPLEAALKVFDGAR